MIRALWTASSGMNAQQLNIDTVANNLANVNTTGFKKSRLEFQDLLYQTIRGAGAVTAQGTMIPTPLQVGHGVRPVASTRIFEQGDTTQTGNALDLLIEGDGFFQVEMPDGTTAYTRSGSFKIDSEGRIVTADGYILQPELVVPEDANSIIIATDGTVSVMLTGEDYPMRSARLSWCAFKSGGADSALGRIFTA